MMQSVIGKYLFIKGGVIKISLIELESYDIDPKDARVKFII